MLSQGKRIVLCCSFFIIIIICWMTLLSPYKPSDTSQSKSETFVQEKSVGSYHRSDTPQHQVKFIAFGHKNFDGRDPWYGHEYNQLLPCEKPCMLTPDKHGADGVMFCAQSFDINGELPQQALKSHHLNQLWMIYTSESPVALNRFYKGTADHLEEMNKLFNYMSIFGKDDHLGSIGVYGFARILTPREQAVTKGTGTSIHLSTKTDLVIGIISTCDQSSGRIEYIKSMTKHIVAAGKIIHVYGSCLDEKRCEQKYNPATCTWDALGKRYKFYLAFENSRCRGYITEKFWINSLAHDMIPIVNGGLSRADYDAVAPPHSFIHTDDFDIPEDLVKYLLYLDNNSTAYNEYFKWRETHVNMHTNLLPDVPCPENPGACYSSRVYQYCAFCAALHNSSITSTHFADVMGYLSEKQSCRGPMPL